MTNKAKPKETTKPFFQGKPTDENTARQALKFFGGLLLFAFMTFLVCSMTNFDSPVLRIAINVIIETLVLYIFYTRGMSLGTEGVSRGEILYQHMQKGEEAEESEKRVPFHKAKGFVIGLLGTVLGIGIGAGTDDDETDDRIGYAAFVDGSVYAPERDRRRAGELYPGRGLYLCGRDPDRGTAGADAVHQHVRRGKQGHHPDR